MPSRVAPRSGSSVRRILSKLMTFGAMIGAGLMLVSTSLPANAFYTAEQPTGIAESQTQAKVQSLNLASTVDNAVARDNYTVTSYREQIFLRWGNRQFAFTNNPNGTIQWPFRMGVPITSGFGPRDTSNCSYCSSFHPGVDFSPGRGAQIQSIADGVVTRVEDLGWGLGSNVVVDHGMINGHHIESYYGHMIRGSQVVVVGQEVKVAETLGLTGSTGASTGSHTHLEIHVDGKDVDPFDWLKANAN